MSITEVVSSVYDDLIKDYKKSSKKKDLLLGVYNKKIYEEVATKFNKLSSFRQSVIDNFNDCVEVIPMGYVYDVKLLDFKLKKECTNNEFVDIINSKIKVFQQSLHNAINHRDDVLDDFESFMISLDKWYNKYIEKDKLENIYKNK